MDSPCCENATGTKYEGSFYAMKNMPAKISTAIRSMARGREKACARAIGT